MPHTLLAYEEDAIEHILRGGKWLTASTMFSQKFHLNFCLFFLFVTAKKLNKDKF